MEITLFGKSSGFGECLLIKISDFEYGIIDSCIINGNKSPVALAHLKENEIDLDCVKFILLTHFHQDHYMGIPELLQECKKAEFYVSDALFCSGFFMLLSTMMQIKSIFNPYTEMDKIINILNKSERKAYVCKNSLPFYNSSSLQISVLAPNDLTKNYFEGVYEKLLGELLKKNAIIPFGKNFNLQSVVLSIGSENFNILLGADLEYTNLNGIGWGAVISSLSGKNKISYFKIPHHGSENGYNLTDWNEILSPECSMNLTPYTRSKLPRSNEIKKFKQHSDNLNSTCDPQNPIYKKMNSDTQKLIHSHGLKIKRLDKKQFGGIRHDLIKLETEYLGTALKL
ncbi:MAG TPA: MBL fold metallo-hydrolase [Saprospiraceae bacterium]|nr:MBL fold metallo-hydrolase [Saprospiraceae bacterium]